METLNEVFLFEFELLAERLQLSRVALQNRIKLRSSKLEAIKNHDVPMSDVVKYHERLLTIRLVYDAVERFKVALDFIIKRYRYKSRYYVAQRMDLSNWRFRRALEGNTKFFNEAFLQNFNKTFDEVFDLEWIMYGDGLMFKDEYLLLMHYGLKSPKEVEEFRRQATIANMKSHDYDKYYDTFRRKIIIKKALNPEENYIIYSAIRDLSKEIVENRNEIALYEEKVKAYQQEIRYKTMEIAKLKQQIHRHRDFMVGLAFLEFYDDIQRL